MEEWKWLVPPAVQTFPCCVRTPSPQALEARRPTEREACLDSQRLRHQNSPHKRGKKKTDVEHLVRLSSLIM